MASETINGSRSSNSPLLARLSDILLRRGPTQDAPERGSAQDSTRNAPLLVQPHAVDAWPNVGRHVRFKGDINGAADVEIDGIVEGAISVPDNTVTVSASGSVQGCVTARNAIVRGQVNGDITASQCVGLMTSARVDGDIRAPRILAQDGARLTGRVETVETALCADASSQIT